MTGLLLIDKPEGLSSFDVVRRVRRALRIKRVGHGGTLDPFATGLLPVAVGDATRLLEFLLGDNKRYRALMRLGSTTDTLDATGVQTSQQTVQPSMIERLEDTMGSFVGAVRQIPPMFSALKRDGVPLYRMARKGEVVQRDAREVLIHELNLLDVSGEDVEFEVFCSKGTYVRSLADDIGQKLGCGAHLVQLRRLASGPFDLSAAVTLAEIEEWNWETPHPALLSPLEAMAGYPVGEVAECALDRLGCGVPPSLTEVHLERVPSAGDLVSLARGRRLLAVARFAPERNKERRGDFELCKVFPGS